MIKRTMIEISKERFLVVDSSKFDQVTFSFICSVEDLDYIITDSISEDQKREYEKLGINIITGKVMTD